MDKPLLSVVVPVYNVKPFLRKCVDSLVAQTYENMEIILVDDGSKDGSSELCDELCEEQKRQSSEQCGRQSSIKDFVVIHKSNGGQSSARNAGIAAAKGDLICFIDSDDWIDTSAYKRCIELLAEYDADVVEYGYVNTIDENFKYINPIEAVFCHEDKEVLQHYMTSSTKLGSYSMCRVVCKKSLLDELSFRVGKINEDIDFKYMMLSKAKRLIVTNQTYYYYRQGNETTSSGGLKRNDFDLYEAANLLCELSSNEKYGTIKFLGEVKKARTAFSLLSKIAFFGFRDQTMDKKAIIKQLTKEHRKNLGILLKSPMSLSRKICAVLLAIHINCLKIPLRILKVLKIKTY